MFWVFYALTSHPSYVSIYLFSEENMQMAFDKSKEAHSECITFVSIVMQLGKPLGKLTKSQFKAFIIILVKSAFDICICQQSS